MRFTCDQTELAKALNIVSKAVTSRSTMPVLKGILIRADKDGEISLSASDNEISIETSVEANVSEYGSVVVNSKLLNDVVRKIPHGELKFTLVNNVATIVCNYTEFKLICLPPDEFPEIKKFEEGEKLFLDKDMLSNMIKRSCFAASIDEGRGIITGVLTEIRDNVITMVALDGFRMAVFRENVEALEDRKIIIPGRLMSEIGKIMSDITVDKDEEEASLVEIVLDEKKAFFHLKNTLIVTRLMEGSFIKFRDVIPKEFAINVVVNVGEVMQAAERASIMISEGKNTYLRVALNGDNMIITAKSEEGAAYDEIKVIKTGDDLNIGFNARYFMDILKAIPDEEVRMRFNSPTTPCLIRPLEGNSYEYMVLPVRLVAGN